MLIASFDKVLTVSKDLLDVRSVFILLFLSPHSPRRGPYTDPSFFPLVLLLSQWLITFLTSQIRPAASHSRTILSLRLLQVLFASELFADVVIPSATSAIPFAAKGASKSQRALPQTFPFQLVFFDASRVRSFLGCLLSTYAEVRILAIELLVDTDPFSLQIFSFCTLTPSFSRFASLQTRAGTLPPPWTRHPTKD